MRAYYENKVAAITGAASGIGLAVTELLLENGATAFMADINGDTLRDQVARLDKAFPNKAIGVQTDVKKRSQVKALIDQAAKFDGHLDFLFNNAGIGATLPFEQVTMEFWKRAIDINLWGVIYGIDAALPIMRRQQSGHIINTSSLAGYIPPTSGCISIGGADMLDDPERARMQLGYMPEIVPLYPEMTVGEFLAFCCALKRVVKKDIPAHVEDVMKTCSLEHMRHHLIATLSKGYRQRVGFAQALCGAPGVLAIAAAVLVWHFAA